MSSTGQRMTSLPYWISTAVLLSSKMILSRGYLRGNKLAITVFDDYDDIVDKTCDAWNFFEQDPTRIASITTRTWATVNN